MKSIMILCLVAGSALFCPHDAQAQTPLYRIQYPTTTNQLYRCAPAGMPTLCYSASTWVPGGYHVAGGYEKTTCDLALSPLMVVTVTGVAIVGGGYSEALNNKSKGSYGPFLDCEGVPITVAYSGKVTPCAPGGLAPWLHQAKHYVNFIDHSVNGDDDEDFNSVTIMSYPLPYGTCFCPDGTTPYHP